MAHWYEDNGILHAYVPYADPKRRGQLREATLKDARPHFWVPSVTTKIGILAKPAVTKFQVKQAIIAATKYDFLSIPFKDAGEEALNKIVYESEEYVRWAQDFGTKTHAFISSLINGTSPEVELDELDQVLASQGEISNDQQVAQVARATYEFMLSNGFEITDSEKTFVNLDLGYAGTIDILGTYYGEPCIVDIKTQDAETIKEFNYYEEYPLQLGAYAMGINRPDLHRISVVTSRTNPGVIGIKEYPRAIPLRDYVANDTNVISLPNSDKAFLSLCDMWRYLRNYDCRIREVVKEEDVLQGGFDLDAIQ